MLNSFDQEKVRYILSVAGTPTPVRRIMSDFNRLSSVQHGGPTASQPQVEAQLKRWLAEGTVRTQLGGNGSDVLYALA